MDYHKLIEEMEKTGKPVSTYVPMTDQWVSQHVIDISPIQQKEKKILTLPMNKESRTNWPNEVVPFVRQHPTHF